MTEARLEVHDREVRLRLVCESAEEAEKYARGMVTILRLANVQVAVDYGETKEAGP